MTLNFIFTFFNLKHVPPILSLIFRPLNNYLDKQSPNA